MEARFTRVRLLGKGSFGSAVLVSSREDGKQYVIKEIDVRAKAERDAAVAEAQVRALRVLCRLSPPLILWLLQGCLSHGGCFSQLRELEHDCLPECSPVRLPLPFFLCNLPPDGAAADGAPPPQHRAVLRGV